MKWFHDMIDHIQQKGIVCNANLFVYIGDLNFAHFEFRTRAVCHAIRTWGNSRLNSVQQGFSFWTHHMINVVLTKQMKPCCLTQFDKQRVLTPGHQGWNDLHSLCRIGMEYYLLNDNNNDYNDDNDNNNNNNDNNNNDDDNHKNNDDDNNNDNNDDASGCFFTNVTFTAVAEISIRGDFFSKAIINSLSLTCFSFISFYSELTSLYIFSTKWPGWWLGADEHLNEDVEIKYPAFILKILCLRHKHNTHFNKQLFVSRHCKFIEAEWRIYVSVN